ncbi:phosphopantetheine-binding protein [Streptomyces sp. NBC_01166]|uniref:phosphopantetheine-binding protein n=1 Tax=unclassified Streptomyces TaxID=2593676 RepID=UPI003813D2F3|nr:phosphopantetheine-binding protein [Streptomyces sp. NBC_01166]
MLSKAEITELVVVRVRDLVLDPELAEAVAPPVPLMELGLNSLMLAQLLIELEAELDVDPFEEQFSITDMRTVQDLVDAYDQALAAGAAV